MRHVRFISTLAVLLFSFLAVGCSSSNGGGGSGGATGSGGGSGSGSGGDSGGFLGVPPCGTEGAYDSSGSTVLFGAAQAGYSPKCLKVSAGATVTFMGSDSMETFSAHPLSPAIPIATTADSPITSTSAGTSKEFTFASPGYYPYYCSIHGTAAGGGWAGVVWVQ